MDTPGNHEVKMDTLGNHEVKIGTAANHVGLMSQHPSIIQIRTNRRKLTLWMNILPCMSGKVSSNGSARSNPSDILEIFWETEMIIRWPMNSSFPNLRNKCCSQNCAHDSQPILQTIEEYRRNTNKYNISEQLSDLLELSNPTLLCYSALGKRFTKGNNESKRPWRQHIWSI